MKKRLFVLPLALLILILPSLPRVGRYAVEHPVYLPVCRLKTRCASP